MKKEMRPPASWRPGPAENSSPNAMDSTTQMLCGDHKLSSEYIEFLHTEFHDLIWQGYWFVLPWYEDIKHWKHHRIAPLGVIPQHRLAAPHHRGLLVSQHQFGHEYSCPVGGHAILPWCPLPHSPPLSGCWPMVVWPPQFIKVDIADGFYCLSWLAAQDIPKLGIAFPTPSGDPLLVAHLQCQLLVQPPEKNASQIWSPKIIIWVAQYCEFGYIHMTSHRKYEASHNIYDRSELH